MAVKKGSRRLTWLQRSHSFEPEIKPIFLINKNARYQRERNKNRILCTKGEKRDFIDEYWKHMSR